MQAGKAQQLHIWCWTNAAPNRKDFLLTSLIPLYEM
jgi:hypothetical protein